MKSLDRWCLGLVLFAWAIAHANVRGAQNEKMPPTQAEKIRKVLDQPITLDFAGQSLPEAVQHLREKTGLDITLDTFTLQQMGLLIEEMPTPVHLKADRVKTRQILQKLVTGFNLSYVVLEDSLLISTEDVTLLRQLRQRVQVEVKAQPMSAVIRDLAKRTGLNVFVDPRISKEASRDVTLELEDTTLETAVRLLAELADLKSVRVGNVLFITDADRASKLRAEGPQSVGPSFPGGGPAFERIQVLNGVLGNAANAAAAVAPPPPPPAVDPDTK